MNPWTAGHKYNSGLGFDIHNNNIDIKTIDSDYIHKDVAPWSDSLVSLDNLLPKNSWLQKFMKFSSPL